MVDHSGHRERLRNRFRTEGLDNFDAINVLEPLLSYCIPRKDTNPLAHRLLDHFGSYTAVFEAKPDELEKVLGVGERTGTFLSLVAAAGRYYEVERASDKCVLKTPEECGAYLLPRFQARRNETVLLLCLDAKCKVLCCKEIGEGSINSAAIPVRRIVEEALGANATSVVIAHNHPSGLALPSNEDIQTTLRIAKALRAVEIVLADHVIVADNDYITLRLSRRYDPNDIMLGV